MGMFLLFNDEAAARKRNREMMDARRKPGNPDGDGKPYVTTELYNLRVAEDGQAILETQDASQLTDEEEFALLFVRPSKFDPPELNPPELEEVL